MQTLVDKYAFRFVTGGGLLGGMAAVVVSVFWPSHLLMFGLAYVASFLFVGSNFLVIRKMDIDDHTSFYKLFGGALAARFILVVALMILVLVGINKQQIFFTVSFIISYICHSVTEIIFIHKILTFYSQKDQ